MKAKWIGVAFLLLFAVFAFGCEGASDESKPSADVKKEEPQKAAAKKAKPEKRNEHWVKLSLADREYLLGVARKAFESWVTKKERFEPSDVPSNIEAMKVNRVFATIYKHGDWRGCVSAKGENAVSAVVGAVINTCKDRRFKNPEASEINEMRIELSFLQPFELIESKDPEVIKKELEPGVHGISVKHSSGKQAFFLPYVFVKKQRSTITWLERICKKAGMEKNAWQSPETLIYRYATVNFIEESPKGKMVDLYRYKVELDEVPPGSVNKAIKLGAAWFMNNKMQMTNSFAAGFNAKHKQMRKDSPLLQAMAAGAVGNVAGRKKYGKKIAQDFDWAIEGLQKHFKEDKESLHFGAPQGKELEGSLILAQLIADSPDLKNRKKLAKKLSKWLRHHVEKSDPMPEKGAYITDMNNYAVFAIARLAALTGNPKDWATVQGLLNNTWKSGGSWSLAALAYAAEGINQDALKERILSEARKAVNAQYSKESAPYADYIGGFKGGRTADTVSTAAYLQGLSKAYGLVPADQGKLKKDIMHAAMLSVRWLLEQQFTKVSAFYFKEWTDVEGAFKMDLLVNATRLDDTSAALNALIASDSLLGKELDAYFADNAEALVK